MNVFLTSLGCRLNEAELQTWAKEFHEYGISVISEHSDADLIVINTCAVTGEAARKSRQTIRRFHRKNPTAKIVVTGCYASLEKSEAESLLGVDLVVGNQEKNLLPQKAKELLEWQSMPYAATEPEESALFIRNRERAFIKIQDGCRYRCTYCIVTIARGEEVSRSIADIICEINHLIEQGIQEIVITGVHVGGYGSDIDTNLYELVIAVLEQTSISRIRFASVEPWELSDAFFDLFKNPRLMPHMHLPIQSGSDKILKKMSRRCNSATFLSLLEKARSVVPVFNITSDIIVGFPGETQQDFDSSLLMVKQAKFGHVHTFSYSRRKGTKAAGLPDQIDEPVKKYRSQMMHKLSAKTKNAELNKMIGSTIKVLWEGQGRRMDNGLLQYFGYTPNYHKVCVKIASELMISNQILESKIVSVDDKGYLCAELISLPKNTVQKLVVKQL